MTQGVGVALTGPPTPYFSASALTFWIPSRITSLLVLFNLAQQKSKSFMVLLSALIFNCISFGFSAFGLPVRGDTSSPSFCEHKYYKSVYTKSQEKALR